MNIASVLTVRRRKRRRRILTLLFLITGLLTITIGIVTYYGFNAGSFVMQIDANAHRRGIILSDTKDFSNAKPRLTSKAVTGVKDITYGWLKLDEIENTEGEYVDKDYKYAAHTFFIKNVGTESVDVTYKLEILSQFNDIISGIRILIIIDGEKTLYQLEDDEFVFYEDDELRNAVYFESEEVVVEKVLREFGPNEVTKISYVMWLEGEDPDTTDKLLGGKIKLQMNFSINMERDD